MIEEIKVEIYTKFVIRRKGRNYYNIKLIGKMIDHNGENETVKVEDNFDNLSSGIGVLTGKLWGKSLRKQTIDSIKEQLSSKSL